MSGHIGDMVSQHWNTPQWLVDLSREALGGHIDLDPCSNEHSVVGARFSFGLPDKDGLKEDWEVVEGTYVRSVFINPPYGKDKERGTSIADWIKKACMLDRTGDHTGRYPRQILVIPASTETDAWDKYIWGDCDAICFLKGRVKFLLEGQEKASSTKGTAVVYYGTEEQRFKEVFKPYGAVITEF